MKINVLMQFNMYSEKITKTPCLCKNLKHKIFMGHFCLIWINRIFGILINLNLCLRIVQTVFSSNSHNLFWPNLNIIFCNKNFSPYFSSVLYWYLVSVPCIGAFDTIKLFHRNLFFSDIYDTLHHTCDIFRNNYNTIN